MNTLSLTKHIPVIDSYDVVVCGGGCAGWVAAISAARAGQRTALIERLGFVGGTATAGIVVPISGFYFKGERVVGGIAWEFVERLTQYGAAQVELPKGHVSVNIEYYKVIAQHMLQESGVTLYTNAYLSDCIREGTRVTHAVIESKNGTEAIGGRCFIDATGDGDLCHMAGIPMLAQAQLQPASLCFILTGVDTDTELLRDCIHHDGKNGRGSCNTVIRDFLLDKLADVDDLTFGGPWFNALLKGNSLAVNITRADVDATDRAALTRAEAKLRVDMLRIVDLLRAQYAEFRHCEVVHSAINAGIRETRHIRALYTLSAQDVQNGTRFACPVAHCAHPMDIHATRGAGQSLVSLNRDVFVPHTTMVSETVDNLIAAGRCISAEREPYASLRVQATLMSVGESAGLMTQLHNECGAPVWELPADELRRRIDARGCVR